MAIALAASVVLVLQALAPARDGSAAAGIAPAAAPVAPAPAAPARSWEAPRPSGAELPPLPRSLRDSGVDGELAIDGAGRFVPTPAAIALFDHFLAATGEEPPDAIRARIVAEIERQLATGSDAAAAAVRDAVALLDLYLAYREAARPLLGEPALADGADLERRLQWIRELRRQYFGAATAEALFGDDERQARVGLAMQRVAADPALSDEERSARLDALEQELPEATRTARAAARAPLRLLQDESALRAGGGSDTDVRRLREERMGPEAADRLVALDRERAEWERRLAAYRAEHLRIEADAALDPAHREAALEELRSESFTAEERIRVRALDDAGRP